MNRLEGIRFDITEKNDHDRMDVGDYGSIE